MDFKKDNSHNTLGSIPSVLFIYRPNRIFYNLLFVKNPLELELKTEFSVSCFILCNVEADFNIFPSER